MIPEQWISSNCQLYLNAEKSIGQYSASVSLIPAWVLAAVVVHAPNSQVLFLMCCLIANTCEAGIPPITNKIPKNKILVIYKILN